METKSTLVLNADGTPLSYLPLSSVAWQDAMKMIYLEQVDVLHEYDDWVVHSPNQEWIVPSVVILKHQVQVKRTMSASGGPSAYMIFLRDDHRCAYCMDRFPHSKLTRDHVVPVSRGGKSTWTNLVTACQDCNWNRGCNERIQPKIKPVRPTYSHLIKNLRNMNIVLAVSEWNYYLNWRPERIVIIDPRKDNINIDSRYHSSLGSENGI